MPEPKPPSDALPSRMPLWVWVGAAAMAALLLLVMVRGRREAPHPAVGMTLPAVELEGLTGTDEQFGPPQLQGKVTLINFWGTWCYYCMVELPHLVELKKKHARDPDFQVLLVSCSTQWQPQLPPALGWTEDLPRLREATAGELQRRGFDVPTYADPRGLTREAFASLDGWLGYPTTLLIDGEGVIRDVWIGFPPGTEDAIERRVLELLQERR